MGSVPKKEIMWIYIFILGQLLYSLTAGTKSFKHDAR